MILSDGTIRRLLDEGRLVIDPIEDAQIQPASVDTVLERLEMPHGIVVSGLESDGADRFYCGGGSSGKVRAVRRPKGVNA